MPARHGSRICIGSDEARRSLTGINNPDAHDARIPTVWRWDGASDLVLHTVPRRDIAVKVLMADVPSERRGKPLRPAWVKAEQTEEVGLPGVGDKQIGQFARIDRGISGVRNKAHAWMSVPSNVSTMCLGVSNSTSYAKPSA